MGRDADALDGAELAVGQRADDAGLRQAIVEAIAFQAADPAGARASAAKFIRLPPEVLATVGLPVLRSLDSPAQVGFWIDVMAQQGMIQDKPDPSTLLVP